MFTANTTWRMPSSDDVAVPVRLRQQALARIHQHHRQVGGGCAGGHVARVLLVTRAVGDDELALVRVEVAVGHVDGDALLAFGGQTIQQQRVIDALPLGAVPAAVLLQRGQLIVEQPLAVVQQATDQRALAVVHAAAGDEAQQRLGFVLLEVGGDVARGIHAAATGIVFMRVNSTPVSSSQRTLGSILILQGAQASAIDRANVKMGPSVRWDDGGGMLIRSGPPASSPSMPQVMKRSSGLASCCLR